MSDDPGIDLFERFPEMTPITKAPTLHTINLIGTTFYGRRDYDELTGTYVGTQFFVVGMIPVAAFAAYRVFPDNNGGWYFLGRVPLSRTVRQFNWAMGMTLLLGVLLLGAYFYTGSEEYKAQQQIAQADKLVAEGKDGQAAEVYRDVMTGTTSQAPIARQKLVARVDSPTGSASEIARVYRVALDQQRRGDPLVKDLFKAGLEAARKHADDPAAVDILEVVAPLAAQPRDHLVPRKELLEKQVEKHPNDVELASRLAGVYEALGERARCEKLLVPHEKQLGTSDGAAILGRLWAAQGMYDRAFPLLKGYVDARLPGMLAAESGYTKAISDRRGQVIEQLKKNQARGFDYKQYNAATDDRRRQMVGEFLDKQLQEDPGIRTAGENLGKQSGVVSAVLDLGFVHLQRAQTMRDAAARKDELEAAEKVFLSVRGAAGDSDRYRLSMGQVNYWLGKQDEAKKLFDETLQAHNRAPDVLLAVARVLRDVGAVSEARKLTEEAYDKAIDVHKKQDAATFRGLMNTDLDDWIAWLSKSDSEIPDTQASLAEARGRKASQDGNDMEAAAQFRKAIEIYGKMPENPATLNNSALAYFSLFRVTHEQDHFTRGLDRMDRAIALQPSDSISLSNAADVALENAMLDIVGEQLDLKALKTSAHLGYLSYLHKDKAGRQKLATRVQQHPGVIKARRYLERVLVVAPSRANGYGTLAALCDLFGDEEGLKGIQERLALAKLDLQQSTQQLQDYYAGKDLDRRREDARKSLARQEKALPACRAKGGVTLAAALVGLAQTQMGQGAVG